MSAACRDTRCTDGVTACQPCHGWGMVNPRGKAYRWGHKGPLPEWAVPCEACHGTGLVGCGCRPLDVAAAATVLGQRVSVALAEAAGVAR